MHWLNHKKPAPLVSGNKFFGRFLLRLSLIKPSQVMSMVKFVALLDCYVFGQNQFKTIVMLVTGMGSSILTLSHNLATVN